MGTNDATTWWQMIRHVGHALFHSQYFISDISLYKQEQGFYSVYSVIVCLVVLVMLHCYTTLQVSSNGTDDDLLSCPQVLESHCGLSLSGRLTPHDKAVANQCISPHLSQDGEFGSAS